MISDARLAQAIREIEVLKSDFAKAVRPVSFQHEAWTIPAAINSRDADWYATHSATTVGRVYLVPLYLDRAMRLKTLAAWIKTTGSSTTFSMGVYLARNWFPDDETDRPLVLERLTHTKRTYVGTDGIRFRHVLGKEIDLDPTMGWYFLGYSTSAVTGKWWVSGHGEGYSAQESTESNELPRRVTRASIGDPVYVPSIVLRSRTGEQVRGIGTDYEWVPAGSSKISAGSAAGGDLAGTYPNPEVAAIHETSGPTKLTVGTVADGEFIKRVGTTLVSAAITGLLSGGVSPRVPYFDSATSLTSTAGFEFSAGVLSIPSGLCVGAAAPSAGYSTDLISTATGGLRFARTAATSGTPNGFVFTTGNHTGLANAEAVGWSHTPGTTTFGTNATLATQRANVFGIPTYAQSAGGTKTFTTVATVAIEGPPAVGTGVSYGDGNSFWVQSGKSLFAGQIRSTYAGVGTDCNIQFGIGSHGIIGRNFGVGSSANTTSVVINGVFVAQWYDRGLALTGAAAAGTAPISLLGVTSAAHTAITAGTEYKAADFNFSSTLQWATGALATQRSFVIQAPTISFVGASTATLAATACVTGAPNAGTNASITDSVGLLLDAAPTGTVTRGWALYARTGKTSLVGDVIIGLATTAPSYTLDVRGTLGVSGTATLGTVLFGDGAAATPSIAFAADTDTGLYRVADNTLGVTAAGAHVASFGAGTFTVGATTPTVGYSVDLISTATTGLRFARTAATSGTPLGFNFVTGNHTGATASVDFAGFSYTPGTITRGAGALTFHREFLISAPTLSFASASTVSMAGTLVVSGSPIAGVNASFTFDSAIWVQGASSASSRITLDSYGASSVSSMVGRRARGTFAAPTAVQSGDILCAIFGSGHNGTVFSGTTIGIYSTIIAAVASETFTGVGLCGAHLAFHTTLNGGGLSRAERLRIHDTGDVSIPGDLTVGQAVGTNPSYTLDVRGTLGVTGTSLFGDGTVGAPNGFLSDTDSGWYRIGANNLGIAVNGAKVLDVATTGLGITGALGLSGLLTSTVAAGSPVFAVTGTSDTPATTFGLLAGVEASAAPSDFIEVTVGGNTRYIPCYA